MSEPASISSGIADRYATAVFELAKGSGELGQLESDVDQLDELLRESGDFRDLIHSPIYSRSQQEAGVAAVADKIGLGKTMGNTLRLMASKRRLFVARDLVGALREKIRTEKNEMIADVRAARPLTDAQRDQLTETLKARMGQDVKMTVTVDEALIGGLVVKVGSKMIDTSIRSKLNALQNTMKEVG